MSGEQREGSWAPLGATEPAREPTTYGASELPTEKVDPTEETTLIWGLAVSVFVTTAGIYYYFALLPAWEADASMGWSKSHTTTVNWTCSAAQALGLLLAGPLADYLEPLQLVALEAFVTLLGLFLVVFSRSPSFIIADLLVVGFAKGILWPALGSIVSQTVPLEKQDGLFFCCALASRLSGAAGDFLLGQLLRCGLTWHKALFLLGGIFSLCFLAAFQALKRTSAAEVHKELADGSLWAQSYSAKWLRLIKDFNGWLALLTLLGTSGLWAMVGYLAVDLKQEFHLTSGAAAIAASSFLTGTFLGLLLAGTISFIRGHHLGRLVQLLQAAIGLLALIVMVLVPHMTLVPFAFCLLVAGMGSGPVMYLPYCTYCSSVLRSQRAFCMGVLDCILQIVIAMIQIFFGQLRVSLPGASGEVMYATSTLCFGVACIATAWLYMRISQIGHF